MRRLFVCAVALLLAGCNAPPETNSTPRTSEPVAPLTTPSTVPLAGDRLPTRLAFEDGTVLRVLDGDGLSIDVGPSGTPVWSSDGRYLAWSTLERDETTGPLTMNAPESWTVYLLDTVTGRRIRYADRQHPLTGVLLAAGSGFVAPLSGRNNLGRDATDFVMLRYADIDLGNAPTAIHADFRLERPTSEYDFDWAAIQGDSLYVVVTDTSTLVYRYNPQLWRVSLGGHTERLFFDAVVGLSNLGMSPLAVSPDAAHVISQTGARSGVCYYAVEPVLRTIDGSFERIDGLPSRLSDGISLFIDSVEWIGREARWRAEAADADLLQTTKRIKR